MKNHGDLLYLCTTVKLDILIAEETYLSYQYLNLSMDE